MKRGLVVLDAPVTAGELRSRVAALQRELRSQGVKAGLLYGDVYRSGDITYLCNLCLYWNEGVLLVPAHGDPALLTKLSARVQPWMRATSTLGQIRSGPDLAGLMAERMRDEAPEATGEAEMSWWGPLGLVEMTWWPAPLVDRVKELLPGLELRDLGPLVRQARLRPSPAELELLRVGGSITGA
ncbi:MAG: aminopeptidase P family N-terminal domain-containing protein, partial [Candidatus Dormibacteraeota bacterium]|nr:aminopeptidase P family N-terminal domain-containing protein [Candidatus Dormibacteraeota bacterium]